MIIPLHHTEFSKEIIMKQGVVVAAVIVMIIGAAQLYATPVPSPNEIHLNSRWDNEVFSIMIARFIFDDQNRYYRI